MEDATLLSWIEKGQNWAALLVAIGVGAEFLLGFIAGPARRRVDEAKDAEIIRLTKETGELHKQAETLRKEAEDERMARTQLSASISWRTPDPSLAAKLASPLKRYAGQRYAFVLEPTDPERLPVVSWISMLLGKAEWRAEPTPSRPVSELSFPATNIVLWVSPTAPTKVLDAAHALISPLEKAALPAVVLQSGLGPQPDSSPTELIRVVIFKKGPRMTINGNTITWEGRPNSLLFGDGPPK